MMCMKLLIAKNADKTPGVKFMYSTEAVRKKFRVGDDIASLRNCLRLGSIGVYLSSETDESPERLKLSSYRPRIPSPVIFTTTLTPPTPAIHHVFQVAIDIRRSRRQPP